MATEKHPADDKFHTTAHTAAYTTDSLKTEQEKGKKDPVDKAVPLGTRPESMEDLGIGPRDPYPDGKPPKAVAGQPMNAPEPPKEK